MDGQRRLKGASILMVGTGGLGAPLGLYLAAAGLGRIGIVDFDVVDESNLQRQVIHGTKDVGRPKIDSAAETMQDINPRLVVDKYETALSSENALEILVDIRRGRGRDGQFSHALSRERCLRSARQAQRLWLDLSLRGPGDGLPSSGRAMLPLPVP